MTSAPQRGSRPWVIPGVAALAVVWVALEPAAQWLEYHRPSIADGQVWRLVTAHWTHWSWDHLLWDTLVLVAAGSILERRLGARRVALALLTTALALSLVGWLWIPDMVRYRGLSGLDCALITALAVDLWRQAAPGQRRRLALVLGGLGAGFAGKLVYELVSDTTLFVDPNAGFVPAPWSHALGALFGLGWRRPAPRPGRSARSQTGGYPTISPC